MKITPVEIRKQEFKKSMRGYDPVEVDTFLDLLAGEYEQLIEENAALNKKTDTLEAELKHFKEVERTLKQTLYKVQETSQQSKENSEKEATLIKKEAEMAASKMIEDAHHKVRQMQHEVNALKQQKESFAARLRHLLSSQLELLDVLSMDEKDKQEIKDKTKKEFTAGKIEQNKQSTQKAALNRDSSQSKTSDSQSTNASPEDQNPKQSDEAENESSQPKRKSKEDYFKDIFGDDIDVDDILK